MNLARIIGAAVPVIFLIAAAVLAVLIRRERNRKAR
jgi:hypothetical protein